MKNEKFNLLLKVVIAILLFLCLADMPYGYFMFVRFASAAAFVYLAYSYYQTSKDDLCFLFGALALLFQPFIKIALGRTMWNIVDVIVGAVLIYIAWKENKK